MQKTVNICNIYIDRIMAKFVKFLNSSDPDHHGYSYTTTQQEHNGVQKKFCLIIYALNFKDDFLIKHFKRTLQMDIDRNALELHLVSTIAFIEASSCQHLGKEVGDSSSTKTESQSPKSYLMGTSFSKLHPKIQQKTILATRRQRIVFLFIFLFHIVFQVIIMEQSMSMSNMRITSIRQIIITTQIQIERQTDMPRQNALPQ